MNHPWWHWLFTQWIGSDTIGDYGWRHTYWCNKCQKRYSREEHFR